MIKRFSTIDSWIEDLKENHLSINWIENGSVLIKIKGNPFLFFLTSEKKGFCKSIRINGFYGNAWDEKKYKNYLENI